MSDEKPMGQVIQIDEAQIRQHLGGMVWPGGRDVERDAGSGGQPDLRGRTV